MVGFITGSNLILEAARNTQSLFWVEEIRTQSSAFEKKEMGMYTLSKQSYWFLSREIFNNFVMRLTKIWGIMQIESFVKKRWRPRWITVPQIRGGSRGRVRENCWPPIKNPTDPRMFMEFGTVTPKQLCCGAVVLLDTKDFALSLHNQWCQNNWLQWLYIASTSLWVNIPEHPEIANQTDCL